MQNCPTSPSSFSFENSSPLEYASAQNSFHTSQNDFTTMPTCPETHSHPSSLELAFEQYLQTSIESWKEQETLCKKLDGHLEQARKNKKLLSKEDEDRLVDVKEEVEEQDEEAPLPNKTSMEEEVMEVYEPKDSYPQRLLEVIKEYENSQLTQEQERLKGVVEKHEAQFGTITAQLSNITEILSRLSQPSSNNSIQPSSSSNLPSQPLPNPKGGLNAITLRSGTTLEEIPHRVMEDVHEEEVVVEAPHEEEEVDTRHEEEEVSLKEPKRKAIVDESIPIPFLSMVKKAKKTLEFYLNMLQVLKKVEITIPLLNAIQQIPKYAKFLKDLCTRKDRIGDLEILSLDSSISSLMKPIPEMCSDPGPCLVSCHIGGRIFWPQSLP
ncbi:hypothetical protein AHAS_Ahas15G0217200 [Arachis hypogaea]